MRKAKAFEVNLKLRKMLDYSIISIIIINYSSSSNEFDIPSLFIYTPKPIHYFQSFYLPKSLSYNIILDLSLFKILDYYWIFVFTTLQKITLKPDLAK